MCTYMHIFFSELFYIKWRRFLLLNTSVHNFFRLKYSHLKYSYTYFFSIFITLCTWSVCILRYQEISSIILHLIFFNLFILWVWVFACMYVCVPHARLVLQRPEDGIGSPQTGVTDCCELSHGCGEWIWVLQKCS